MTRSDPGPVMTDLDPETLRDVQGGGTKLNLFTLAALAGGAWGYYCSDWRHKGSTACRTLDYLTGDR